jgi:hypothetical protein
MKTQLKLRPSSLPKLALCGQFENAPGTSDAAARGTKLDAALRSAWEHGEVPALEQTDAIAIAWAYEQISILANGMHVTMDEAKCRIQVDALNNSGTADAICLQGAWHADLKTGQIYDYEAQMAAYAMGLMAQTGKDVWVAYLLFADQQKVVTHFFTPASAAKIVQAVIDNVGKAPTPNDYCAWCAKSLTCSARIQAQEAALAVTTDAFQVILNDPEKLGVFLQKCRILDDFREAAEAKCRELIESGETVTGWELGSPRITRYLTADTLRANSRRFTKNQLIDQLDTLSLKKAEALFGKPVDKLAEEKQTARPLRAAKKTKIALK